MRNHSLDVLRGAAALLVFCYHSEGALLISRFGWTGVDLFFVLSGFLVSGLLFREYAATQDVSVGRFLMRRAFKIYPPFYFLIGVTFALDLWRASPRISGTVAELLFVQNYVPGLWSHTWSIAVEEHFYILLCALIWFAVRKTARPLSILPKLTLVIWVGIMALRIGAVLLLGVRGEHVVYQSHFRFDSLLTGVLIAYYHAFHAEDLARWMKLAAPWLAPASILLLAPVTFRLRDDAFMLSIGFSLVSLGFGLLLLSVLYPTRGAGEPGSGGLAMAWFGRNSYGFYLWHGPVIFACDGLELNLALKLLLTFAISTSLAAMTTQWIEGPALRLRDRWFPSVTKKPLAPVSRQMPKLVGLASQLPGQ